MLIKEATSKIIIRLHVKRRDVPKMVENNIVQIEDPSVD